MRFFRELILIVALTGLGCSTNLHKQIPDEALVAEATLAVETQTSKMLKELPPAKRLVTLSVYQFDDQTGQNKPGDTPNYSRAVTQGGLAVLKQALLDAGNQKWFRVLERGGLQNLLQERQIIRSMREQYTGPEGGKLPPLSPLLYSGVLLEGGIIAYESNLATGGVGARYLGIGANTEYRRDMVTVALQAVSVSTGEVLAAVSTSKTILSTATQGGAYYFVSFDKILEAEAGITSNEPPQLAVRQAIEMSVYALVMEGYKKGLWQFSNQTEGDSEYNSYIARYYRGRRGTPESEQARSAETKKVQTAQTMVAPSNIQNDLKPIEASLPAVSQRSEQPTANPEAMAADNVGKGWYVQVLAVKSFDAEEQAIIDELKRNKLPVTIHRAMLGSTQYYRIMVGPYASKEQAEASRSQLAKLSSDPKNQLLRRVYVIARI